MTPTSIAECRVMIDGLRSEIKTIETQLADRNKTRNGKRMLGEQYHAWRRNALRAMDAKLEQLRQLNRWKAVYLSRLSAGKVEVDPNDPESLLRACYVAHEKVREKCGVTVLSEQDILPVFDLVRDRVLGVA